MRRALAAPLVLGLAMASSAWTTPARADDDADGVVDRGKARAAYERGLDARRRGEARKAAEEFARADRIAPSTVALQAGLDAAIEADDAAIGAELLERSKREPPPPALASSITSAHLRFSGRAGRIRIGCPPSASCKAKIDERRVDVDRVVWAPIGQRSVTIQVDGAPGSHARVVEVTTDQLVEVVLASKAPGALPSSTTRPPVESDDLPAGRTSHPHDDASGSGASGGADRHERGLPPIVFYAGAGLTVVLAATSLYFGLEASHQHGLFKKDNCSTVGAPDCDDVRTRGQDNQTATNIALGTTALFAAATAAIGIAFTNWNAPTIGWSKSGANASWSASF